MSSGTGLSPALMVGDCDKLGRFCNALVCELSGSWLVDTDICGTSGASSRGELPKRDDIIDPNIVGGASDETVGFRGRGVRIVGGASSVESNDGVGCG